VYKKSGCFALASAEQFFKFCISFKRMFETILVNRLNPSSMEKLKLSFNRYTNADLGAKAETIVTAVTNNAGYFPTPAPTLATITDIIGSYMASLIEARAGGRTAVALKNMWRGQVRGVLGQLGNYVMLTAAGDKTILIASGFDLAKPKEPTPPLDKPGSFRVVEGINTGELFMSVKTQKGAKSYQFQVCATDPTAPEAAVWVSQVTSKSKTTFPGLESGKRYWCRVGIAGPFEQQVYSDVITKIAQ
jgi:hypothetical protein